MFTTRYTLSPYIKQTRLVFKGLNIMQMDVKLRRLNLFFFHSLCELSFTRGSFFLRSYCALFRH